MEQIEKAFDSISGKLLGWGESLVLALPNIIIATLIVVAFWLLSKWVYNLTKSMFGKTHLNESLEHLLANIVKVAVIVFGVMLALSVLQLQKAVFSMLAGVGVLGLALGFAFQDLAANFVAGIMIAVRSPMKLGDVVEINDIQGTVIDIRLRDTLIRNFDGQNVVIPNKDFMTDEFTNYSSFGQRKVKVDVGVDYNADLIQVKKLILDAVNSTSNVKDDPEPAVYVNGLGDSAVNLTAHFWIKYPGSSFLGVRDEATIKIKQALDGEKINLPFPTRTLALRPELEQFVVREVVKSNEVGEGIHQQRASNQEIRSSTN